MTLEQTKATFAGIWVVTMLAATYAANTTSIADWTRLAAFIAIPPIAMWILWNDPPQTTSESIQKARR